MRAVVLGGGSWGSTFAALLARGGHEVTLGCRDPEQVDAIRAAGRNPRYVPDLELRGVTASAIADALAADADLVAVAVPSAAFAEVAATLRGTAPVLVLTKGLDPATGARLSELVRDRPVAALSGPNHAEEIGLGLPAATVVASAELELATWIQHELISPSFRVYASDDLVGVELCAAAKNVIAVAAGAVDGLALGDNAKASLVSRGVRELARLGGACGARPETFAGLAGLGDLVVTCWSRHSRNRLAGELLVQGRDAAAAAAEIGQTAEALTTAPVLRDLSRRLGIELPITEAVCRLLDGVPALDLVSTLMAREPTTE